MKRNSAEAYRHSFWLTFLPMCLFAVNLAWIPTVSVRQLEGKTASLLLCGAVFWLSAVLSAWMLFRTERLRKRLAKGTSIQKGVRRPGFFCFFQNLPASIADTLLFVSLCVFCFGKLYKMPSATLFPVLSAIVLLFILHAMLNGRNYQLLCSIQHTERSESEKRNSQ